MNSFDEIIQQLKERKLSLDTNNVEVKMYQTDKDIENNTVTLQIVIPYYELTNNIQPVKQAP